MQTGRPIDRQTDRQMANYIGIGFYSTLVLHEQILTLLLITNIQPNSYSIAKHYDYQNIMLQPGIETALLGIL